MPPQRYWRWVVLLAACVATQLPVGSHAAGTRLEAALTRTHPAQPRDLRDADHTLGGGGRAMRRLSAHLSPTRTPPDTPALLRPFPYTRRSGGPLQGYLMAAATARLVLWEASGWVCPRSRGLCVFHALLPSSTAVGTANPMTAFD
jgi:hypothetical protein